MDSSKWVTDAAERRVTPDGGAGGPEGNDSRQVTGTVPSQDPRGGFRSAWTWVRASGRFLVFAAANLGLAAVYLPGLLLTLGSADLRRRLRNRVFSLWAQVSLACVGVRVTVHGTPPQGPCFLVANHLVYLDIWVLAAATPAVFVAESGIARWPFFGFMAKRASIIFIDRSNRRSIPEVNRRIEAALDEGQVLALFPEGRTGDGVRPLPFRSSLFEPAARGGHPVAWATIHYRTGAPDPPASEVVVWKDGVGLPWHARRLLLLDRIEATVTFGDERVTGRDRKVLAAELERRVAAGFSPIS
jgi:1-acyl-sn-glycerol-3-phosphate acyltransferase